MTNKPLCIYHANCPDGFAAALIVRMRFGDTAVDFHAGSYGAPPPDVTNRDIIMVDFSYKKPVMQELEVRGNRILVIDHHKSAQAELADYPSPPKAPDVPIHAFFDELFASRETQVYCLFDMGRSGAGLAWDYFIGGHRPPLINHIEDRDLWTFKLDGTAEIHAAIMAEPMDFPTWDALMVSNPRDLWKSGLGILAKHRIDCDALIQTGAHRMRVAGHDNIPVINAPFYMASDLGNRLSVGAPFAAVFSINKDREVVFSLRSQPDGLDVSKIAEEYGGGGHKHAAGFKVKSLDDVQSP